MKNKPIKILITGFLVLFAWSALSNHIYVCDVKGLCSEREAILINKVGVKNAKIADSLPKTLAGKPVTIPESLKIYFKFDKYEFNSDALTDKYFSESKAYLDQNSKARINITGYADAVGSIEYNQALGYKRSQSVQHNFESKSLPVNRIIIESMGEKEPVDNNNT